MTPYLNVGKNLKGEYFQEVTIKILFYNKYLSIHFGIFNMFNNIKYLVAEIFSS